MALFLALAALLGKSVNEFTEALPRYRLRFVDLRNTLFGWLGHYGIAISKATFVETITPEAVMDVFGKTLGKLVAALSTTLLVDFT